jgi:glycosyltransferase involved in cell wall biosynthesis
MRILHIGKYYPPAMGGMERFLADLVAEQRRSGEQVFVLVHDDGDEHDDPPWLMRCPVWMQFLFAPISPTFPLWLARAIERYRPDVLHIHMPNPSAFWALMLPSARRIPWIIHWHSDVEPSRHRIGLRLAYPHYSIFERAMLEHAHAVIATSRQYLESSRALETWRYKAHVVPLGVDSGRLPELTERDTQGLWHGKGLRILAAGRLAYYKGFDTLVRAVIPEPDWELVLVGDGEERRRIARILRDAGNPMHIRVVGEVDDATLYRFMSSCDVFALPSRERTEAFGLVLVEAMRYSRPLVVGNVRGSGMHFLAHHGQNALLAEPENVVEWREALRSMAAHPSRRALMGRLGFERYRRELSIESVWQSMRAVYRSVFDLRRIEALESVPLLASEEEREEPVMREPRQGRLLVVIPALNEAQCIGSVVSQVRALGAFDILVVDDGSTDDTAAIALLSGARVIRATLWQGAWGAMQTGIRYAMRKGYGGVITMDGDGQHEPSYLAQLLEAARDADVVIAACPGRGSAMRHVAWKYFRAMTGFRFEDLTSGFRYYNVRACRLLAAEEATLLDYQDIGVLLLLRHANLRIAEISVAMNPRRNGASRVFSSWWTVARYMAETSLLCLARWNQGARKP